MRTVKPTPSQSLARCLAVREIEPDVPFIAGVWAIFGPGNVAGSGEALQAAVPHPARHPALPRSIRASRDAAMTGSTPSDPASARSAT